MPTTQARRQSRVFPKISFGKQQSEFTSVKPVCLANGLFSLTMSNQSTSFKIAVILEGDNSKANKAIDETGKKIDKLNQLASKKLADNALSKLTDVGKDNGVAGFASDLLKGTGALESFAGAALPVVGAITAVSTAAVGAGTTLFALAKDASDFGSEIWDANQKTGISTETLQALRFEASQGGVAFSDVSGSINKFAKVLGSAKEGNLEAQKTMKMLGVSSYDMETALGQAYQTILKYPDGVDQMKASQEAFSKSGPEMIAFLKEFGGNISEAKRRAQELGLILDEESIKAADKFGDTLDMVSLQARTTAARFALEFAPAITRGMNDVSQFLAANQDTFREWGKAIGDGLTDIENEIKAKGNNFEAVGEVVAEKIGEGLEIGLSKVAENAGSFFSSRLKEIFTSGQFADPRQMKFLTPLIKGFSDGLGITSPSVTYGAKIDTSALDSPTLRESKKLLEDIQKTTADLKKNIGSTPSLADKLKLDQAEADAKRAEAQYKTFAQTVQTLGLQVSYFGDESEVARVSQQLLSQGITDLNSGMGRAALAWAGQLDNLKKAKKEQDDYNAKIKDWRKELENFRDKAYADALTPNPTDLQRFDAWLDGAKVGMKDLRVEAEATRDALKWSADYKAFIEGQKRAEGFENSVADTAREMMRGAQSVSPFENKLYDLAKAANLAQTNFDTLPQTFLGSKTAFGTDEEDFVARAKNFLSDYESQSLMAAQAIQTAYGMINANNPADVIDRAFDTVTKAEIKNNAALGKLADGYKAYLGTLRTLDKNGKEIPIFQADYQMNAFIDQLRNLARVAADSELKSGLASFDKTFADLGVRIGNLGASTGLEKLNNWFTDPGVSAAIDMRAKELGYTADQLREIMRQAQAGKDLNVSNLTRPRIAGAVETDPYETGKDKNPFQAGLFGGIGIEKFKSEADMYGQTLEKMGQMGADAFNGLAQAIGSSVENWVLYGDASGEGAKKAIASALAATSAQATASAIMETAYGIAALTPWGALLYGPAPLHFQAAAMFAGLAAGTAVAGRAVAGDSFKNGKSGGSNQSAFTANYGGNNSDQPLTFTRQNNQSSQMSGLEKQVSVLSDSVNGLNNKISGMRKGDVLVAGIKENRGLITQTLISETSGNTTQARKLNDVLGN